MQAIVQDRYGTAEVLESRDIERPEVGGSEGPELHVVAGGGRDDAVSSRGRVGLR